MRARCRGPLLCAAGMLWGTIGASGVLSETKPAARVTWTSESNVVYQVQWSPSAASNDWFDAGAPLEGNGEVLVFYDAAHDVDRKFYRVVVLP